MGGKIGTFSAEQMVKKYGKHCSPIFSHFSAKMLLMGASNNLSAIMLLTLSAKLLLRCLVFRRNISPLFRN